MGAVNTLLLSVSRCCAWVGAVAALVALGAVVAGTQREVQFGLVAVSVLMLHVEARLQRRLWRIRLESSVCDLLDRASDYSEAGGTPAIRDAKREM